MFNEYLSFDYYFIKFIDWYYLYRSFSDIFDYMKISRYKFVENVLMFNQVELREIVIFQIKSKEFK